jgi:DNA polymerase-3 subunit epsilon
MTATNGYAVLDLETTGLNPNADGIVEICVLLVDAAGREQRCLVSYVHPGMPIPVEVGRIHGITDAVVANAPRMDRLAEGVNRVLSGRVIVGHNVGFDLRFLEANGVRPNSPVLDTLPMARTLLPGLANHKLVTLRELFGVATGTAHRAEADVRATWEIAKRLLAMQRVG